MVKCPRCHIQQEESPQCAYCGFVFNQFNETDQTSKIVRTRWSAWVIIIFATAGVCLVFYGLFSYRPNSSEKKTTAVSTKAVAPRTQENDLLKSAKELSGDAGIVKRLVGGTTKGGIIAIVIFSIIGLGYFTYGKKSRQLSMVVCGIALMGYSYFVSGTGYIVLVGVGLSALPFILGRY